MFKEKKQQQVFEGSGTKETLITIDTTIDPDGKWLKMEDPPVLLSPDEYAGQKQQQQNSTSEGGKTNLKKIIIDEVRFLPSNTFFHLVIHPSESVDNVPSGFAGCYLRYQGLVAQGNCFILIVVSFITHLCIPIESWEQTG
jgi:hypothetical protein